jgi:hypothetical protein
VGLKSALGKFHLKKKQMNEEKKAKKAKEMEDSTKKMRDALRSELSATPGEVHVDKFKKMQKIA